MSLEIVNPASLGAPRGFSHGMLAAKGGRLLCVAGQVGIDGAGGAAAPFADQFARALDRVLAVIAEAGGSPADLARLTVYVTDLDAYRSSRAELGAIWRAKLGTHYPAMALVQVAGLVDRGAMVEMEATAVLPG